MPKVLPRRSASDDYCLDWFCAFVEVTFYRMLCSGDDSGNTVSDSLLDEVPRGSQK